MNSDADTPFWAIAHETLPDLFCAALRAHPDRLYCKSQDLTLTYAQAAGAIHALAQDLKPKVHGRTVAIVLPNSAAFLVGYFAALAAGAAPALVNYAHPDPTVAKLLDGVDVAAVLSDRDLPDLSVTRFDDTVVASLASPINADDFTHAASSNDIGAILFSGGTTGLPKQVAHTNAALIKSIERMEWGWPTGDAEVWLPVAPFTHVYGYLMGVTNPLVRAGSVIIPPRFQPDLIVQALHDENVTVFGGGPPAIYQALMSSEKLADARLQALHICPGGGAPFPLDAHRRWHAATGLSIAEGYGMTEIAPISVNTRSDGMQPGAAGKAVPDTQIEIVDVQTGKQILPLGESGEIRVRGPHLMTGYTGNPEETAIALRDGFLYTGDIGRLDADGFLTISDRKKDVILVKGYNVLPREVEETLLSHDAVSGACVVGRSDERAGEVPVAYITTRSEASADAIRAYCAETLADYKLPAEIIPLDALPLTPAGKVDRTALRARANDQK